jgi:anaerobic selenocysteine-containing dehydrogenase
MLKASSLAVAGTSAGHGGGNAAGAGSKVGKKLVLRLVAKRPMWDAGTFVTRSPSLAGLHPSLVLCLNPADHASLVTEPGGNVRVSTKRASIVVAALADPAVPLGTAVLPFNLPEGGAGSLIDASAGFTELTVEHVGAST